MKILKKAKIQMRLKNVVMEDFVNYKKPSMFLGTVSCNGKCCIEAGIPLSVCQNDALRKQQAIDILDSKLCQAYLSNPITSAIVIGGLEPFEQFDELYQFISTLRYGFGCKDDVVIYTGYYHYEIPKEVDRLSHFENIIIKFGRYVPISRPRYDAVLGITLASENQFGVRL